jgi:hypothetical protein
LYGVERSNEKSMTLMRPMRPATRTASTKPTLSGSDRMAMIMAMAMPVSEIRSWCVCVQLTAFVPPEAV